jgi:hypothetical protein
MDVIVNITALFRKLSRTTPALFCRLDQRQTSFVTFLNNMNLYTNFPRLHANDSFQLKVVNNHRRRTPAKGDIGG